MKQLRSNGIGAKALLLGNLVALLLLFRTTANAQSYETWLLDPNTALNWDYCRGAVKMVFEISRSASHTNSVAFQYKNTSNTWQDWLYVDLNPVTGSPRFSAGGWQFYGNPNFGYTMSTSWVGNPDPTNYDLQQEYFDAGGGTLGGNMYIHKLPPNIQITNGSIEVRMSISFYDAGAGVVINPQPARTIAINQIAAPLALSASQNNCTNVDLTWSNPTQAWHSSHSCPNYGGYSTDVYRNGTLIASHVAGTSYTDNDASLTPGVDYTYTVKTAWLANGNTRGNYITSDFSSQSIGRLRDVPNQVPNVNASDDRCDGSIKINWDWYAQNPTKFIILRNGTPIDSVAGGIRTYTQTGLTRGTTYTYSLRAKNSCNRYSTDASDPGISPADPPIASGVNATYNTGTQKVNVIWTDNSSDETKFQVVRQDDLGSTVFFDVNQNSTSFDDDGVSTCRIYNYKVKVFSGCATGGLISTSQDTTVVPPPNLNATFNGTTNKVTGSKGYFTNRVELSWSAANPQNMDLIKIWRKVLGTTDSVLIAAVNPSSGLFIDNTCDARVFYEYTMRGERNCNGTILYSNLTRDVGFRNPMGTISGHIEYTGGIAVADAKVVATPGSGASGMSLQFNGGSATAADNATLETGGSLRIECWIKPLNSTDGDVFRKNGAFRFERNGASYRSSITTGTGTYIVNVPAASIPSTGWTHVSVQYSGTALTVYLNGVSAGSTAANGTIVDNASPLVLGNSPHHFKLDEFRMMGAAVDAATTLKDFGRYMNGNEAGFRVSLHNDEGVGNRVYDVSKNNNVYNANHFSLSGTYSWVNDIPDNTGVLRYCAYTDTLGNYLISGVRYLNSGDNYTVVPSKGVHAFSPNSRSVFIGDNSQVFTNQDFTDVSSFLVTGTVRYKNCNCMVPDAPVLVDGMPVILNGQQVKTDNTGFFSIQVPIGNHFVKIEQYGHAYDTARFPATGTYNFQGPVSNLQFIDSTTRTIVGRVVGGLDQANKAPGMGRSENNIGKAKIKLVSPPASTPCFSQVFTTNSATGEYRFTGPPLQYRIDSMFIQSSPVLMNASLTPSPFTNTNVLLDMRNQQVLTTVIDTLFDNLGGVLAIDSAAFHKRHDMIYRIRPTVAVTDTLGNKFLGADSLKLGGTMVSIVPPGAGWGPFGYPVFLQGSHYAADIHAVEIYTNTDNGVKDTVLLNGTANITNGMVDGTDPNGHVTIANGLGRYSFECGAPNTAANTVSPHLSYTKDLQVVIVPTGAASVTWKPNETTEPATPNYHAFTIGKRVTGTGVATQGPEKVDIILRDPPGSGSSSSWEAGQSIVRTEEYTLDLTNEVDFTADLSVGTSGSVGIGVETDVDLTTSTSLGLTAQVNGGYGTGVTETITSSYAVSTRDDPDNVGAAADIFVGRSRNWYVGPTLNIELQSLAGCAISNRCFGDTVNGMRMARVNGYAIAPGESKTRFSYTQSEIETVVIPTLESIRATYLTTDPRYTSNVAAGNPGFGSNNDDPLWGPAASTPTPFTYEAADTTGSSYTFHGRLSNKQDTVRVINTQISLWKQALAQNEKEKIECKFNALSNPLPSMTGPMLIDNFTLGSAIVTNSYTTDEENTTSGYWELSLTEHGATDLEAIIGGSGVDIEASFALTQTTRGSYSSSIVNTTSLAYTLTDGDPGDIMSVDVYKTGTGNVFITRGGQTMCPYEDAVVCHYFNMTDPDAPITSHTYNAAGFTTLAPATIQREMPEIQITPAEQYNIPSNQQAVYQLILSNQSPLTVNNDIELRVYIASQSNPFGAIVKIDGLDPNTEFTIPTGASVVKTLTVERGPIEIAYDSIMVVFASVCSDEIADTAYISAHFIPTCTELSMIVPNNNWVFNNSINNTANVVVSNYNYNYGTAQDNSTVPPTMLGLNKIALEVRPSNTNVWSNYNTFYKYPTVGQDTIPNNQVFSQYSWDISQFADGNYELKAISYCLNHDGSFATKESPIMSGVMDRVNPQPFGTPSPADGILDPNDDIRIQFNEPLDLGSINWNNFQVRGVLNGTSLRHAEFLNFDGTNDYAEVPGGVGLQSKDFTIEFWARATTTGAEQVIVSQGIDPNESLSFGLSSSDKLKLTINGQTVESDVALVNLTDWNHYAAVYKYDDHVALLYRNGVLVNMANTTMPVSYNGSGKLYFGKQVPQNANYYSGHLHEVRVWNKVRAASELVAAFNSILSPNTSGLVHNWQMDEAAGMLLKDKIRERNAVLYGAAWQVDPNGFSGEFDGTDDHLTVTAGTVPITKNMDATIEFWFNSAQTGVATLFSSGKGDGAGLDSLVGWEITKDASGYIHVYHHGLDFQATDSNYFDGSWHHFALVLNRSANISAYVDGNLQHSVQSVGLGAMSGPYFTVGARGFMTSGGAYQQDRHFQGKLDEVRVWNASRKYEQIRRDMHNRMKGDEYALTVHIPFESYTTMLGVPVLSAQIVNTAPAFPLATVTANGGATTGSQTPVIKLPRPVESVNFNWLLNNDQIVITPTTAPELLENQTIDITVKDLYDLHGNKMESPKTWIAYFNKNQVYWQQDLLQYDIAMDSSLGFTATILNTGGASKAYTISGLPAWLTADISSGVIAPNSSQVVHFTVEDGMNVGQYYADIAVTTDFNYDELLRVSLNVHGTPPDWDLDPTDFQYSMAVIGQIKLDGVINGNPGTQIAGFMNGTLCALGNLQYVPAYDRYEVFLNLLSNTEIGDSIRFEIYDANTGNVYVYVTPSIWFADGELMGTISNPVTFNGSLTLKRDILLHAGWTWISLPLASENQGSSNDLMDGIPFANGDVVKGQTVFDQYDAGTGWIGSITGSGGYDNVASYKVRKATADTLHLIGTRIHPDSSFAQINLVPGWNWIGFMSTKNLPLGEALGNYNANDGDLIKSQYQFAYYDGLSHSWIGSLTTMVPGMGYVMQTSAAGSFHYPLSAYLRSGSETLPQIEPFYDFVPESYAKTMSATVYSNLCVTADDRERIVLGAFDQSNNLRGYALYQTDPQTEKNFWYLTVYSNDNAETLALQFFDNATGALIATDAVFDFEEDALLGTNADPLVARVSATQPCDGIAVEEESTITVDPNPFSSDVAITFEEDFSGTIGIYDLNGKLLFVKAVSNTGTFVISDQDVYGVMADGVYMLRINDNDGTSEQKRIIKLND